jgi:hypothetical protein
MKKLLLISLSALIAATPGASQTAPAAELKWMDGPPGLPAGAQFAVIKGNPAAKGMFTIRARLPGNYAVPPHWHPTDEKVSVIFGRLAYGMGDRLNRATAQGLNPGENVVMKAKMHHWALTADGAEIEVSAMGPFSITYVDPTADPRNVNRAERGR